MISRETFEQAGRRLVGWRRTMILSHDRPDGDALGAMAAMKRVIESAGREATAFIYDEIPGRYAFLDDMSTQSHEHGTRHPTRSPAGSDFGELPSMNSGPVFDPAFGSEAQARRESQTRRELVEGNRAEAGCYGFYERWQADLPGVIDARFDGVLIVDTDSWSQLKPVADYLRASRLPRIVVDHHATADGLSSGRGSDLNLIDASASATCQIVHAWCGAMGWLLDIRAAEAIFTGLSTDTGWFRHSNTDARAMRAAADLIDIGVRPDVLHGRLYGSFPASRVRLMAEMLGTLTFHADEMVAVASVTPEMFRRAGASKAETEDLVNEPMSARPVIVSAMLVDAGAGEIRVSFRSKSPEVCGRDIDVAAVAGQFGGGGHRRAAGARLSGTLEDARRTVTETIVAAVGGSSG